jgi:hypothetical protein
LRPACHAQILLRVMRTGLWARLSLLLLLSIFPRNPVAAAPAVPPKTLSDGAKSVPENSEGNKKDYVGSQACASCHRDIYSKYLRTDMGRSMSKITPALLEQLHIPAKFYDQKVNRHYEVYSRDGKLYQSEFELDPTGKETFRDTHQIHWLVGSGANSIGGIVQREDYLFEAPLTLYTKPMTWASSPGYEFADYSFSRPILEGCIFCHSGRANPVPGTNGRYSSVAFSELAIGCENCHGPGSKHVDNMKSGKSPGEENPAIVNPARLSPELANNICMQCHEFGDDRVLQPGKSYQDIRAGVPLDNTLAILMMPPDRQSPPQSDHLQHYYSMTLSKCYRASGGRLRCITCHDPHVQPTSEQAPAFYNKRCLTCHTEQSCRLSQTARQQGSPPDNCISCHMPKRDVKFIAHTSLTSHRIVVRPGEPFPDSMFQQTTTELPDLIHLNSVPAKEAVSPWLLTLLQAYSELAAYKAQYVTPYFRILDQLQRTDPDNVTVLAALGSKELKDGKLPEAIDHLQRSLALDPKQAAVRGLLSEGLEKLGRSDEALAEQQKAVAQDPYNPTLQRSLVLLLIRRKQYGEAQAAMSHYLEIFPQDTAMRQMLAASEGETQQQ